MLEAVFRKGIEQRCKTSHDVNQYNLYDTFSRGRQSAELDRWGPLLVISVLRRLVPYQINTDWFHFITINELKHMEKIAYNL